MSSEFTYNIEELPALQSSVNDLIEFCEVTTPAFNTDLEEISKQSGADKFITNVNSAGQAIETLRNLLKDFIGEEGGSVIDGTLYGYIKAAQKLNAVLN